MVYFAMSSLLFGEVANRIGRVILQDLIGFLGRRYAFEDPAKMTPLTILIDEFSNVAYPGFIDALNKGGGARAGIMLAMQSLADPEAPMGKDGTQRVLDNLNTRIWFRLTDDATAKLAVEGLGTTSVSREEISHSLSFGGGSATSGGSRGAMQYVDRSLVRPEWVTGLPRGEAFVRTRGENWKLRVPLLEPVRKEEVRKVAAAYGLEGVLAELKEQAKQVSGKDAERLAGGLKASPSPSGSGKGSEPRAAAVPVSAKGAQRLAGGLDGTQAASGDEVRKPPAAAAPSATGEGRLAVAVEGSAGGVESETETVQTGSDPGRDGSETETALDEEMAAGPWSAAPNR